MENKRLFIETLGDILREYSRENVNYTRYVILGGEEFVEIVFMNGHRKQVNITGDSCIAIMKDLYKAML